MKKHLGFTVIEALLVIALIALIAAILLPKLLLPVRDKQEATKMKDTMSVIERSYREAKSDPDYNRSSNEHVSTFIKDKLSIVESGYSDYDVPDLFPTNFKTGCMGGPYVTWYRFSDNTLVVIAGDPKANSTNNEKTFICVDLDYNKYAPKPGTTCPDTSFRGVLTHNNQKFDWEPAEDSNPEFIAWYGPCSFPGTYLLNR